MQGKKPNTLSRVDQVYIVLNDLDRPAKRMDIVSILGYTANQVSQALTTLQVRGLTRKHHDTCKWVLCGEIEEK